MAESVTLSSRPLWIVVAVVFIAGLIAALGWPGLGRIVMPVVGLTLVGCGLFLVSPFAWVEDPAPSEPPRPEVRRAAAINIWAVGACQVLVGMSQLGESSWPAVTLQGAAFAGVVFVWLRTRRTVRAARA